MDDADLQGAAALLNATYGNKDKRHRFRRAPADPEQVTFSLDEFLARVEAEDEIEQAAIDIRILSSREGAAKTAREKAALSKPKCCEGCGCEGQLLSAHHVTPYAELKRQGIAHLEESHVYMWVCVDCHADLHPRQAELIRAGHSMTMEKRRKNMARASKE